ncbi:hypothetical protein ElyMa_006058600 [Elysia marginata]|uniref:IBB domain-containing protein n=1 Tax=Elysia marginata TaxID=1093978 RepID=A0AAV4GLN6_9GAST|nr:hypothetical protein ElyMa_006058600 [Elysia marginata]
MDIAQNRQDDKKTEAHAKSKGNSFERIKHDRLRNLRLYDSSLEAVSNPHVERQHAHPSPRLPPQFRRKTFIVTRPPTSIRPSVKLVLCVYYQLISLMVEGTEEKKTGGGKTASTRRGEAFWVKSMD